MHVVEYVGKKNYIHYQGDTRGIHYIMMCEKLSAAFFNSVKLFHL